MKKSQKKVYQWMTNSNAAPFFSDTDSGFTESSDPMSALEKIVKSYKHPCGLFAAAIKLPTPENPVVARYLSARAATQNAAPCGLTGWREDRLYVDGKKVPEKKEVYELVKGGEAI
jgi:hypothetical protein